MTDEDRWYVFKAVTLFAAFVALCLLSGCARWMPTRVERVEIPVVYRAAPPPELLQPFTPSARPAFMTPDQSGAVAAMDAENVRRLKLLVEDLHAWGNECRIYLNPTKEPRP